MQAGQPVSIFFAGYVGAYYTSTCIIMAVAQVWSQSLQSPVSTLSAARAAAAVPLFLEMGASMDDIFLASMVAGAKNGLGLDRAPASQQASWAWSQVEQYWPGPSWRASGGFHELCCLPAFVRMMACSTLQYKNKWPSVVPDVFFAGRAKQFCWPACAACILGAFRIHG